jgi:putative RNA 2'-phosphotransferase
MPLSDERRATSKFLSFVLRHEPEAIGITLDAQGWVDVDVLLEALAGHGKPLDRAELEAIVSSSDKQRFALSTDRSRIRANQGHSVQVDLALPPALPPDELYHGTATRFLPSIRERGLLKGERHHVHLSATRELAVVVGQRRGKPHVLVVDARGMVAAGFVFFRSDNGVWLTEHVPARFLTIPPAD